MTFRGGRGEEKGGKRIYICLLKMTAFSWDEFPVD